MALLGGRQRPACSVNVAVLVAVAWLAVVCPSQAQQRRFNDREVKAVFLFNFAQFTEWPPRAFSDPQSPIVIGILGEDPFGRALDDVVTGEAVRNRQLVIERLRRVEDIKTCHILFISPSEAGKYEQILARLQGRPILTVGDTEGFSTQGGMIRFLTEQNRIRLRINVGAARGAGLSISSRVLRAAEIVETTRTP